MTVSTDSIEIYYTTEGVCECDRSHPFDWVPTCRHEFRCRYGTLTNADADPRWPISHLVIMMPSTYARLSENGPERKTRGDGVLSVSSVDGRRYVHLNQDDGRRYTWELFDAHLRSGKSVLLGVWPD